MIAWNEEPKAEIEDYFSWKQKLNWYKNSIRKTLERVRRNSFMAAACQLTSPFHLCHISDSSPATQSKKEDNVVCSVKESHIEPDKLLVQVCLELSFAVIYVEDWHVKPLAEESFKTFKQVNKIKLMSIECSLVIFYYFFHDFETFRYTQLSALSSLALSYSERQDLIDYEKCFRFAGQIRLRAVHRIGGQS